MADINKLGSINPYDNQNSPTFHGKSTPSSPPPLPPASAMTSSSSLANFFQGTLTDYLENNKNSYSSQDYNNISSMLQEASTSLSSSSASLGQGLSSYISVASSMGFPISSQDISSSLASIALPESTNAAAAVQNLQSGLSQLQGQISNLPEGSQLSAQTLVDSLHKHVANLSDASSTLSLSAEELSSSSSQNDPEKLGNAYTNFTQQNTQFLNLESSTSTAYSQVQQAISTMQANAESPQLPQLFQPIMGDVENLWSLFSMSSSTGQIPNSPQSFAMLSNAVNSFVGDYQKLTTTGQQIPPCIQEIFACTVNLKSATGDTLYSLSQQFLSNPANAYTSWQNDYASFTSNMGSLSMLSKFFQSTPQSNSPLGNFWQDYKQQFVDPTTKQPYALPTYSDYQLGAEINTLTNALQAQPVNYSEVSSLIMQLNQQVQQELLNNPDDGYAQAISNLLNAPNLISDPNSSLVDLANNGNANDLQAVMTLNTNGFSYASAISSSFEKIYVAETSGWLS